MVDGNTTNRYIPFVLSKTQRRQLQTVKLAAPNKVGYAMSLAGVTQVQLASSVGLTQPYISSIVNGDYRAIPLETTRCLATFFGCSIEDLFPAREQMAS